MRGGYSPKPSGIENPKPPKNASGLSYPGEWGWCRLAATAGRYLWREDAEHDPTFRRVTRMDERLFSEDADGDCYLLVETFGGEWLCVDGVLSRWENTQ